MLKSLHPRYPSTHKRYHLLLLSLFFILQVGFAQTCTYTLELFDTFGDGWNGSILTVSVNGVATDYTFNTGDEATFNFDAMSNDPVILSYAPGFFENEVSYNVLDPSGNIIFSDGPFPEVGEVFIFFACPTCPGPLAVYIDNVGGVDAEISWSPSDSIGEYTVEYGLSGFVLGTGNTITTIDTAVVLNDLLEDTSYDFYVSIACENGDTSAILGPISFQTIWLIDVGITNILTPLDACGLESEFVEVILQNFGALPQSLVTFNYSVNGIDAGVSQPTDGFYTGVLSMDSLVNLTFETTFDFSQPGEYEILAWTSLEGDINTSNDTASFTVTNIPTISDLPYFIDFETWDGGWKIDQDSSINSTWEFGMPMGADISAAASGVNAFVTDLDGNYNNSELSYVVSPCFDFSLLSADPVINFSIYYETETNWDGAWLEASTDGGFSWSKVGTMGTGVNWYNVFNTTQNLGDVWGGNSGGWINAEHPLTGLAGESQVRFRFAFDSDGSVNGFDGIGLDDILITPVFTDDLSLLDVSTLQDSDCGSEMDMVTIEIRNAGTEGQTGFDVSYRVNGGDIVTENVGPLVLNPQAVVFYTFSTPFDSRSFSTTFEVEAWTSLSDELNLLNDTTTTSFSTVGFDQLPIVADFEDGEFPAGWTFSDNTIGNVHNNVSIVVYDNLYAGDQNYEVTTSNIGPINASDSLTYDYRYTEWSAGTEPTILGVGDVFTVEISIDCGANYTIIDQVDMSNHTPSAVMTNRTVDLSAYAGEVVKLRFRAVWGTGDYWIDLDNINIIGCPLDFGLTVNTSFESSAGANDGTIEVEPSNGTAPYEFMWSDPNGPTDLTAGVYTLTITDALGCQDVVEIELGTCPENLAVDTEILDVSAEGNSDGSISLNPGGGVGPYTYLWDTGDSTQMINNLPVGDYTVTVTDINNCSDEITLTVDLISSTIERELFANVSLVPNPTQGQTNLAIRLNQTAELSVQVISLVGQVIYNAPRVRTRNDDHILDLSAQPSGVYFVRIIADNQSKTLKLIKAQ